MDSGTAAIRILVSSAFTALIVALVLILNRNTGLESTRGVTAPSGNSIHSPVPAKATVAVPPVPVTAATKQMQALPTATGPVYAVLPLTDARRDWTVSHCFTSATELTVSSSPREIALVSAAQNTDWKTVRRMLDAGASVESANDNGLRP